jgi:hypothetical protein
MNMSENVEDIIIANPMYDVVFKLLMADKEIARYFVGTILGEEIVDINFAAHDYSFAKDVETDNQIKTVGLARLDFVATIRTKDDEFKKVLIEIQQSPKPADLFRFRSYLGIQYLSQDNIVIKDDKIESVMPIIVIYMLGFNLDKITDIVVKIIRSATNILNKRKVNFYHPLFDALTHDAYFVQVSRIKPNIYKNWNKCSDLLKMLSLFELNYFVDEKFLKKYPYPITDKIIKKMKAKLEFVVADPKLRRAMLEEDLAKLDEMLWLQAVAEKDKTIAADKKTIAAQAQKIAELERKLGLSD